MTYKQYPKPLSEKSLQKKYAELNMSDQKINFLKQFILSCTNLYGCISIQNIWYVYKELSSITDIPKIKRIDIVNISEVLRREELPYRVYEVDELYSEELRNELHREFVSKYLISSNYGKLISYYRVMDKQINYDYYVPENLLSFVQMPVPQQEKDLLDFVGKLKVTASEYKPRFGKVLKCPDRKNETLNSFSFMNNMELFLYKCAKGEAGGTKGNPKVAQQILDESNSKNEAEKIIEHIKWYGNLGHVSTTEMITYTLDELGEVGVELTVEQMKELTNGIMNLHNHSHQMCMRGWRPVDLAMKYGMPKAISFGPGIKKQIAEGNLDKDELIKSIKKLGLEFIDD